MVKRLKEGGAAWDVKDKAGHTALTWAVDGGHAELVGYILKEGFPVRTLHMCNCILVCTVYVFVPVTRCMIQ